MSHEIDKGLEPPNLESRLRQLIEADKRVEYVGTLTSERTFPMIRLPSSEMVCGLTDPSLDDLNITVEAIFRMLAEEHPTSVLKNAERDLFEPEKERLPFKMLFADRETDGSVKALLGVTIYYDVEMAKSILEKNNKPKNKRQ